MIGTTDAARNRPVIDLARLVCEFVGFTGDIVTDSTKPDRVIPRLMSNDKLKALGWSPFIPLRDGLAAAYADFKGSQT